MGSGAGRHGMWRRAARDLRDPAWDPVTTCLRVAHRTRTCCVRSGGGRRWNARRRCSCWKPCRCHLLSPAVCSPFPAALPTPLLPPPRCSPHPTAPSTPRCSLGMRCRSHPNVDPALAMPSRPIPPSSPTAPILALPHPTPPCSHPIPSCPIPSHPSPTLRNSTPLQVSLAEFHEQPRPLASDAEPPSGRP